MEWLYNRRLRPFSVISFDLDDTLYDNVPIMQQTEQNVQDYIAQNYPQTRQWDLTHWRNRRMTIMRRSAELSSDMTLLRKTTLAEGFTEAGVEDPQQAAEKVMQQFHHHRSNFSVPESSHRLLKLLSAHYRLAAISNGNVNCEKIGIADYFDVIVQPSAQLRGKPHPDMFNHTADFFKINHQQLLHIGDHPYSDILGAHRAGCQSGWFRDGLGTSNQLRVLPTFSFTKLEQLAMLVGEKPR
ncbi:HAD-IA family hydrolase [Idiomarina seosinensis]|uniref:Phosphoesterase n=1 Tax=Idiomarina seosinensis TaxID=281739 RepID=A0A432Z6U4_9GAMM|nr:HAD-IA family hydrolase [Idiomarina seosinensis]RUO73553.1 phosphoesterase [Idiomarina seosinensis]